MDYCVRNGKKLLWSSLGAALIALSGGGSASASMIGDEVSVVAPTLNGSLLGSSLATVGAGPEFEYNFFPGGPPVEFRVDLDAESITLSVDNLALDFGAEDIITIADLDWVGMPGEIVGFSIGANNTPVTAADISFTADSVTVALDGSTGGFWSNFDSVTINLDVAHVPEPGTALLLGMGLLGLARARRRSA